MSLTREYLRSTEPYRTAVMNGYRIYIENYSNGFKFRVRRRNKETDYSQKITTLKQFQEQLIIFIAELENQKPKWI